MGRAQDQLKRSKKAVQSMPTPPAPAHAQNMQTFNDRSPIAHDYERRAEMQDAQGDGYMVNWNKGS